MGVADHGGRLTVGLPRRFGQFARALRELSRVPAEIAAPVARAVTADMRRNFRSGVDPYQRAYAPLEPASLKRGRRPPPLRKYARAASARPLAGAGLSLVIDHPQAGFHQTGTSVMAKRIVLPDGSLPKAWTAIIRREFQRALRAKLRAA